MSSAFPRREAPCNNCPWRRDSPAGEFAAERYDALRSTAGAPGAEAWLTAPMFACHKSSDEHARACAGWLAVCGGDHMMVRLAVAAGDLPGDALRPGDDWPPLFGSYEELAERNGAGDGSVIVRHFVCANCGGEFHSEVTIEELEAEAREAFGEDIPPEDRISVCDDCYPVLMEAAREAGLL